MKNLVLALCLALASGLAFAETESAEREFGMGKSKGGQPPWAEEVGLTDEQRTEIRKIRRSGGSRDDVMAVLTPEQREILEERKASRKGSGGNLDRMKQHLQLSDEQYAEMKKIRDEGGSRKEMFEVLTPEQKEKLQASRKHRKGTRNPHMPQPSTEEAPPA